MNKMYCESCGREVLVFTKVGYNLGVIIRSFSCSICNKQLKTTTETN